MYKRVGDNLERIKYCGVPSMAEMHEFYDITSHRFGVPSPCDFLTCKKVIPSKYDRLVFDL